MERSEFISEYIGKTEISGKVLSKILRIVETLEFLDNREISVIVIFLGISKTVMSAISVPSDTSGLSS